MIPASILVVDDDVTMRYMIDDVLTAAGYHVECAPDAQSAWNQLDDSAFDLVVTDIRMKGLSGLALLKAAREKGLRCKILVMTGNANRTMADEALALGADGFILKPFDNIEELLDRVKELTGQT